MNNPTPDNQRFMVGVNPSLLDTVYDVNFWPEEVHFSRFNFRMGQRFLDNSPYNSQNQSTNMSKSNPSSFQEINPGIILNNPTTSHNPQPSFLSEAQICPQRI